MGSDAGHGGPPTYGGVECRHAATAQGASIFDDPLNAPLLAPAALKVKATKAMKQIERLEALEPWK